MQTPGPNVIKLFTSVIYDCYNKLECLFLASLARDKHSGLLLTFVNCGCKKSYNIGSWDHIHNVSFSWAKAEGATTLSRTKLNRTTLIRMTIRRTGKNYILLSVILLYVIGPAGAYPSGVSQSAPTPV